MNKWIGAAVLAAVAMIAVAWQQGWLAHKPVATVVEQEKLNAYVPADTVLYVGGTPNPVTFDYMREIAMFNGIQEDLDTLLEKLEEDGSLRDNPVALFFAALGRNLFEGVTTLGDFAQHNGIDFSSAQALYMDGVFPVFRLPLQDEQLFWQTFHQASEKSGLASRTEVLGDQQVSLWRLSKADGKVDLDMAIYVKESLATITFLTSLDQEPARLQRLALAKPAMSLADTGEIEQIIDKYRFSDDLVSMLHLQRLAEGLLRPDSNSLARTLDALLSVGDPEGSLRNRIPVECSEDMIRLTAGMPRLVGGYKASQADGDRLTQLTQAVFEISDQPTLASLEKLRGHLPSHTLKADQQAFGFGMAVNVNDLVPALTELWNAFVQAKFTCPQLQEAQQKASQLSPAYIGMFTGMAQGVAGAGASLFDLQFTDDAISNLDFLVSLGGDNPQLLLSMINGSPFAAGNQIPADGSLTEIDLAAMAPGLKLKAGIKGKHIVAFSGSQGQAAAEALAGEGLEANGLFSYSLSYMKLADLIMNLPADMASQMDEDETTTGNCTEKAVLADILRLPFALALTTDITPHGLSIDSQIDLEHPTPLEIGPISGRYEILDQSSDCAGRQVIGQEEIRSDGTGTYVQMDESGNCELIHIDYRWTRNGNRLLMNDGTQRSRDDCSLDWPTEEPYKASCTLLDVDQGFRCLYSEAGEQYLYRYQLIN